MVDMKIRTGFVSNSSSSSFVILGVPVSLPPNCSEADTTVKDVLVDYDWSKFTEEFKSAYNDTEGDLYYTLDKFGLESYCDGYEEEYIGQWPDFSKDNVTVGDMKKEVEEKLKCIFNEVNYSDIGLYHGEYYEG
jgi:hypothetical protein